MRIATGRGLTETRVIAALWLALVALILYRLPFGVSNRDEAFYSAMPYSFLLGTRPYMGELAMHQNAGILMMPFFRVYLAIKGSAEGIVLFNRYLYLGYLCVCSLLAYRFVMPLVGRRFAAAASLLVLLFSYCNLFALSYNTLGAIGFACGVLLSAGAATQPRPAWRLFGASAFFLSAMFAYPGFAPAVAAHALVLTAWLFRHAPRSSFVNALWGLAGGLVLILLVVVPIGLWLGHAGFERLLSFSRSMGYARSAFANLTQLNVDVRLWRVPLIGFALLFALLPLLCRAPRIPLWSVAPLSVLGTVYFYVRCLPLDSATPATIYLLAVVVLAPASVACNPGWEHGRRLLALVWLPGLVAMLCAICASAQRVHAAPLGALTVELAGVVAFAALVLARGERAGVRSRAVSSWALVATLVVMQVHSLFATVYDDQPKLSGLDTRVTAGPMRGTITTRKEAELQVRLAHDLNAAAAGAKTITVFDNFATGYLYTALKPQTFTHWIVWVMSPEYCRTIMEDTFGPPNELPDIVVKIYYAKARRYWPRFERKQYELVVRRPELDYAIYRRRR
jgi:hypothetical protein